MAVRVNGRRWSRRRGANGYVAIDREWRDGDRVEVTLPMTLRAEPLPGTHRHRRVRLRSDRARRALGREGLAPGNQIIVNERESGTMLNAAVEIPVARRRCRDTDEADPAGSARDR